jgi:hypothetical protein
MRVTSTLQGAFLRVAASLSLVAAATLHAGAAPPEGERAASGEITEREAVQQVRKNAAALCWELHQNYRSRPDFRRVYDQALAIHTIASAVSGRLNDRIPDDWDSRSFQLTRGMSALYEELGDAVIAWLPSVQRSEDPLERFSDRSSSPLERRLAALGQAMEILQEEPWAPAAAPAPAPSDAPDPFGGNIGVPDPIELRNTPFSEP